MYITKGEIEPIELAYCALLVAISLPNCNSARTAYSLLGVPSVEDYRLLKDGVQHVSGRGSTQGRKFRPPYL